MLISRELLKNAVNHFPRWMDVRKRYLSSVGGNLLKSISDEMEDVQEEINDYIDQFFIPFYGDKCNIIPDFIYKANIGVQDINSIELVEPKLDIIDSIKKFYETKENAYYQDGFLFFRDNVKTIKYKTNGYTSEANAEKMHVWNAYDEFATFVGIARFENETNEELYNRILSTSSVVINSSEDGLKNAIISSLINIVPEITKESISMEQPTASNLVKYYDNFGNALDTLMKINRDVLSMKRWDIDKWENSFKQIDYIPHVWDIAIDHYTNGIGDNDDLKPVLIDTGNVTDIDLSFYKKSEEKIDTYIKNKNIDDNLTLSLYKYNNVLDSFSSQYKVISSEAIDLQEVEDGTDTMAILYETSYGEKNRKISDISRMIHDIDINKTGFISKDKYYRVKFLPKSKYDSMKIYECRVVDENDLTITDSTGNFLDLKREKDDYIFDGETLVNKYVKRSITKKSQLDSSENIVDTGLGFAIDKINQEATVVVNVDECNGEQVKLIYDCELTRIEENNITLNNFFYDDENDAYLSDASGDEKSMIINIKANKVGFKVNKGQCHITATINGEVVYSGGPLSGDNGLGYETSRYNIPQNMKIEIISIGMAQLELSALQYSNYDLIISTDNENISVDFSEEDSYYLPMPYSNNLNLTLRTRTQYPVIIRKIFIGRPMNSNDAYESDLIFGEEAYRLSIDSNCDVELYEANEPFQNCNKYDPRLDVKPGFTTNEEFTANSNNAYIILDTSDYVNINYIKVDGGNYEAVGVGKHQSHMIRLRKGERVTSVIIDGHYNTIADMKTIHELVANECIGYSPSVRNEDGLWIEGDRLYISNLFKCFIVEKINGKQIKVDLTLDSFKLNSDIEISKAEIINKAEDVEVAYINHLDDVVIGSVYTGAFSRFYLYPRQTKEYVAINENIIYSKHKEGIEIVNTFNNGYIENSLMAYKVEPISEDFDISFNNDYDWTIGKKSMKITVNKDDSYNITKKVITEKIKLSGVINLKDVYTAENKESIELNQYIIDTEKTDYEVVFKHDINDINFERSEFIDLKSDGFNKLRYSNILAIKYIGREIFSEEDDNEEIDPNSYTLDCEKGIIVWHDKKLIDSNARLYVVYAIKKAIAIKYDIDYLYSKVQFPIDAYRKRASVKLIDMEDGRVINLLNPIIGDINTSNKIKEEYKNSDVIYATCSEPGFEVSKASSNLTVKKVAKANTLAVKSGYYYMFGKEFYLFAKDQDESIVEDEYVTFQEVTKVDQELFLHKKTLNSIKNSKMKLGTLTNTYSIKDFNDIENLKGSSRINSITACDSYNHWCTLAMKLSLQNGLNGLGILFEPTTKRDVSYALLDIDRYVEDKNYISFHNPDKLNVFIGVETINNELPLVDTVNISTLAEIVSTDENDINYAFFSREKDKKYYLVVRGAGVLDDIIIQDGNKPDLSLHQKNISTLNIDVKEAITSGVISRVYLNNEKGNKRNGTEINSQGFIVNASNVDWNTTKIKSISSYNEWMSNCELSNVDIVTINDTDCIALTENAIGNIKTKPIYIGDPKTAKCVTFKINNIPTKEMTGFDVIISQAQTAMGPFIPCKLKLNNTSPVNSTKDLIYPYVQLSVNMPHRKVIENIELYIEYKSTELYAPNERIESRGHFISDVLDSRYSASYKIKKVGVSEVSGDIGLYIRASREGSGMSVWSDWYKLDVLNGIVLNNVVFEDYRFYQIKAELDKRESKLKIEHIEVEVIK